METEQTTSAPYVPWPTFLTGLDHLANISIPNEIEQKTFTYMNPHNKAQMVSALRFFGLISKDNKPQPLLSDLAHKKERRPELMRELIETHYPDIVALDFAKMTPTQLENALAGKTYNVSGDTRKKAKTFLLRAAKFAGYTPHTLLTKITRNRRKGAGKQAAAGDKTGQAENGGTDAGAPPAAPRQDDPKGSQKMIQLRRGGSLSLSLSINLWELKGEDRNFVFELIDKIDAYEEGSKDSADDALKLGKDDV